jgi:hypothetical protein
MWQVADDLGGWPANVSYPYWTWGDAENSRSGDSAKGAQPTLRQVVSADLCLIKCGVPGQRCAAGAHKLLVDRNLALASRPMPQIRLAGRFRRLTLSSCTAPVDDR